MLSSQAHRNSRKEIRWARVEGQLDAPEAEKNKKLFLEMPNYGGHVGFIDESEAFGEATKRLCIGLVQIVNELKSLLIDVLDGDLNR